MIALNLFWNSDEYPVLNEQDKNSCEDLITLSEIGAALDSLNGDSSAGSDGLSVPFYKVFWYKINHILLKTFNQAIQKGELSSSQKRGIITLLHKGDNRKNLSNWRPISLLNTDYKIFSKVISFRINNVLP